MTYVVLKCSSSLQRPSCVKRRSPIIRHRSRSLLLLAIRQNMQLCLWPYGSMFYHEPCNSMLFILRHSNWSTLTKLKVTDLVVHSSGQTSALNPTINICHEHRYCGIFSVTMRERAVMPGPISIIIVQVSLRRQLFAERVALLYDLFHTLGLFHPLQFGFFLLPDLFC